MLHLITPPLILFYHMEGCVVWENLFDDSPLPWRVGVVFMFEDPLTELTFTIILIMLILTMIWLIL